MFLKIAIMNNSGNVGKSMVCDTFLKPRLPNAETIKIETINSDGSLDETISAKDVKAVFEKIDLADVALIDIGASNVEVFMSNLSKLTDAHEDIDYFFIPTTPKAKQQVDTAATVDNLIELGVEPERIKIIFNFYDPEFTVEQHYPIIFNNRIKKLLSLSKRENIFTISDNPVFDMIGEMGKSFIEIANDDRDFKTLIRATQDKEQRALLSHQRSAKRLAMSFVNELDMTFSKLSSACDLNLVD